MTEKAVPFSDKLGKETHAPVEVQGVFRDWMIKRMLRPAYVLPLFFFLFSCVFLRRENMSGANYILFFAV